MHHATPEHHRLRPAAGMLVSADRFATGMTCFAISQILLGMGLALMHWVTR